MTFWSVCWSLLQYETVLLSMNYVLTPSRATSPRCFFFLGAWIILFFPYHFHVNFKICLNTIVGVKWSGAWSLDMCCIESIDQIEAI